MASTLNGLLARGNPAAGVSSAWACVMCLCLAGAHGPFQTLPVLASQTCTSPSCVLRSLCLAASHSQSQTSLFHTGLCPSHLVPQPRASTELRFTLGSRELSASASLPHSSPASHLPGPALGHGAGLAPLAVGRALGCVTGMPPCGRAADPTLAAGAVSSGRSRAKMSPGEVLKPVEGVGLLTEKEDGMMCRTQRLKNETASLIRPC